MFEKVVLRRSENGPAISIGQIAEAMLFYGRVHVVLDHGTLSEIVKNQQFNSFMLLLSQPNVSSVLLEDMLGTKTQKFGPKTEVHGFTTMVLSTTRQGERLHNRKTRLINAFVRLGYDKKQAARNADRLQTQVSIRRFTDYAQTSGGISSAATADMADQNFVREAIRRVIENTPDLQTPSNFEFSVVAHGVGEFQIITNLELTGKHSVAELINDLLVARADLAIAAYYGGDFQTSIVTSQIIRLRVSEILQRSDLNKSAIDDFKEIVLPNSPSVREVIDSGQRSPEEFLKILDKSRRFNEWIKNVGPDENIVREYFEAMTAQSTISNFPAKSLRFVLGLGAGLLSPGAGAVASFADSFLLDRLFAGWRPNHFIDNKLKPFVGQQ